MWWSVEFVFALRCVSDCLFRFATVTVVCIQGVDIVQAISETAPISRGDVHRSVGLSIIRHSG